MRIDIDRARALAHDLLRLDPPAITGPVAGNTTGPGFHESMAKALATYTDNAHTLTRTTHRMGERALHTLTVLETVDEGLAADLTVTAEGLT